MHQLSELSFFTSSDIIQSIYRRRYGRDIKPVSARDIRACFIQGIAYLRSAETADIVVKPLLLYYSVLSLCRGIIMFRTGTGESQLVGSHGIEPGTDWRGLLRQPQCSLLDLSVQFNHIDGTFTQLIQASKNENYLHARAKGGISKTYAAHYECANSPMTVNLDDIISRIPFLRETYRAIYDRPSNCLGVALVNTPEDDWDGARRGHLRLTLSPKSPEQLEKFKEISKLLIHVDHVIVDIARNQFGFLSTTDNHEICAIPIAHSEYIQGRGDARELIKPLNDGQFLSEICTLFVLSYSLGMLVRYFPGWWMRMLSGSGDQDLPVIMRSIEYVESHVARHVVSSMTGEYKI